MHNPGVVPENSRIKGYLEGRIRPTTCRNGSAATTTACQIAGLLSSTENQYSTWHSVVQDGSRAFVFVFCKRPVLVAFPSWLRSCRDTFPCQRRGRPRTACASSNDWIAPSHTPFGIDIFGAVRAVRAVRASMKLTRSIKRITYTPRCAQVRHRCR